MDGAAGFTVWFTGLSGSGKSTIARIVAEELRRRALPVELLSGSEFRRNLSQGLGFSREDRVANVRRIGYVAKLLTRNGVAVVTTAVSPDREARDECRRMIGRFVEVWVDCPLEVCEERDPKGLYRQARAGLVGPVAGVHEAYEPPHSPEVVLHTGDESAAEAAARVVRALEKLGYVPRGSAGDPDEEMVKARLRALHNR